MSTRAKTRREFLRTAAAIAALAAPSIGFAQEYPSKPIKIIVGYAPGERPMRCRASWRRV